MLRKEFVICLVAAVIILGAATAWAQETQGEAKQAKSSSPLPLVTAGFAMAIAAAGCGYAQSKALTAACEGVSRNPGVADSIRVFIFLGLAFIEFLALLTFVVALLVYAA